MSSGSSMFKKVEKSRRKLKLTFCAPSKRGKTWWSLETATGMSRRIEETTGKPATIALIDSDNESSELFRKYFDFDSMSLKGNFDPIRYIDAIREAQKYYDILIVDSLSPAWNGAGGALSKLDDFARRNGGNTFGAWASVTPIQELLLAAIRECSIHLIVTLRAKTQHVQEVVNGRTVVRNVGMGPIQRKETEYEFDVFVDINDRHEAIVKDTRFHEIEGNLYGKSRFDKERGVWVDRPAMRLGADLIDCLADMTSPAAKSPEFVRPAAKAAVDAETARMIHELFTELGVTPEQQAGAFRKRDATSVDDLSPAHAADLLITLTGIALERKVEEAAALAKLKSMPISLARSAARAEPTPVAATEGPSSAPSVPPLRIDPRVGGLAPADGLASEGQIDEIYLLFEDLGMTDDDIAGCLARREVGSVAELTVAQVEGFAASMKDALAAQRAAAEAEVAEARAAQRDLEGRTAVEQIALRIGGATPEAAAVAAGARPGGETMESFSPRETVKQKKAREKAEAAAADPAVEPAVA